MTKRTYDDAFWEELWSRTLRENADKVTRRPPNAHLVDEVSGLAPGRALDAGCGHGAESLWLAAREWHVTAVDFAPAALAHGRAMAEALGPDVSERLTWIEADLSTWSPPHKTYDLVACLYVHVPGSVPEMVRRMADSVAVGGRLLMVGHRPIDPATGAATAAAGQVQVSVDDVVSALDPSCWEFLVAQERPRSIAGTGTDAVIHARRVR